MHLLIQVRGQEVELDNWLNQLQTHYLTYNQKLKDYSIPQSEKPFIQLGVQAIRTYSINFPEEHLDNILRALNGSKYQISDKRKFARALNYALRIFRKFFGLQDVPEKWSKEGWNFAKPDYIDVKYLATKKDAKGELEWL